MAHSERTRPSRNGTASLGQRAVSPQPPSALWQMQLASPDQAEFALCEQTIFAMSSPIVLACATDASSGGRSTPPPWHLDAVGGRPPHHGRSGPYSPPMKPRTSPKRPIARAASTTVHTHPSVTRTFYETWANHSHNWPMKMRGFVRV